MTGAPFTLAALPELVAPEVAAALFTTLETDEEIDETMLKALEDAEDAAEPAVLAVLVVVALAGFKLSVTVELDMVVVVLLKAVVVKEQEWTRPLTSEKY